MWITVFRNSNTRILQWTNSSQRKHRLQVISFSKSSSNMCFLINGNIFAQTRENTEVKFCSWHIKVCGSSEAYTMPFVWPPVFDCRKLQAQWRQNMPTEQAKRKVSNACTEIAYIYGNSTYIHTFIELYSGFPYQCWLH